MEIQSQKLNLHNSHIDIFQNPATDVSQFGDRSLVKDNQSLNMKHGHSTDMDASTKIGEPLGIGNNTTNENSRETLDNQAENFVKEYQQVNNVFNNSENKSQMFE